MGGHETIKNRTSGDVDHINPDQLFELVLNPISEWLIHVLFDEFVFPFKSEKFKFTFLLFFLASWGYGPMVPRRGHYSIHTNNNRSKTLKQKTSRRRRHGTVRGVGGAGRKRVTISARLSVPTSWRVSVIRPANALKCMHK